MHLEGLDLNLLIVLDALYETRNVTRAGARLNMSQSATSSALARLRNYFRDDLFVSRPTSGGGWQMVPTPLAISLAEPVRSILLTARAAVHASGGFDPATSERTLRIVAAQYIEAVLLAEVVSKAGDIAPRMTFEIIDSISIDYIQAAISRAEVDFTIGPIDHMAADQPHEVLFDDFLVCVAWSENSRVDDAITAAELSGLDHVDVVQFTKNRMGVSLVSSRYSIKPNIVVSDFHSFPLYVVGTERVCILPYRFAVFFSRRWPLKISRMPEDSASVSFYVQWNGAFSTDPAKLWFRELLRSINAEHEAQLATG
jgi:DNA-binding transcriptional LysR family regulator